MGEATPRAGEAVDLNEWCDLAGDKGMREAADFYRSVLDVTRGLAWDAQVRSRA